ncbi:hypothetical protein K3X13_12405 [Aliiroseovarius crassostreae]|uniref:calcium-binding protein n=1 Tax=Aliiroseovarius crassostreae TaxID=154981 RepID=UPI0022065E5C|nr:hypothetical protein [Aliiroseovarius crassostreae]UWP91835.1 hypothetical protein K3X13_12405 [Aliiroseovarius crassostreae]
MLLGLLFLGLVPAAFMAEGFLEGSKEVEPDDVQPTTNGQTTGESTGDFLNPDSSQSPDDGDVLNPIDQPGEGAGEGPDATFLDKLLAENTDAIYGLQDYDKITDDRDPDPVQLGDGDDVFVGSSDGTASDAALQLFNGTPFVDLQEDELVEVIDGQGGDDTITTGDDASFAFGGAGDDLITVGAAPAAVFGGEGNDQIVGAYTANEDQYSGYLDGGLGNDSILGGEGIDLIFGGQHDDTGDGPDDDTLSGGAGDDQIAGGYGADEISGDTGDDILNHLGHAMENSGAERSSFDWHIDGDSDTLDGGEGNDTLIFDRFDIATGGEGADNFHLYSDQGAGLGHATVTDFVSGEDFLRITLDPDVDPDTIALEVTPSDDGADSVVSVNGEVVAILQGAPGATVADLYVEVMEEVYA